MTATVAYLQAFQAALGEQLSTNRLTAYATAAELADDPLPLYRLAEVGWAHGRQDLWHRGIAIAFTRHHETYEQLYRRGRAKIMLSDWSGWTDFEARTFHPSWGCSQASRLDWTRRAWDGDEDLSGQTLLVRHQGGVGDDISMLRFMPDLIHRTGHVILDVMPELVDLVRHSLGSLATVLALGRDWPTIGFDRHLWSLSLPSTVGEMPAFVPLTSPARDAKRLRRKQPFRIGACWACSATASDYLTRSIPLALLAPLFDMPDTEWHSLQVGPQAGDVTEHPAVLQPMPSLRTFMDTAMLIHTLDCVISVDTAVCHLAGALDVPTFLLLRCGADWKWGVDDTTAWYPSMRLIRQPAPGDWNSVVQSLSREIESQLAQRDGIAS